MKITFPIALAMYVTLGLIGAFTLTGKIRLALWVFLAGLAVKTLIAWKARE